MSLDWDLFRALYRLSDSPVWQVESHPDVRRLGSTIGVSANTVWRRLREWRTIGFLRAHVFFPNPRLFGLGFEYTRLLLSNPVDHLEIVDRLELVDGVVLASTEFGEAVYVTTIADSPSSRSRRLKLLASLPGVREVAAPQPVWLPTPTGSLRPSDFRLIAALRSSPDASFARLAGSLGMAGRTFARRFRALRTSSAMLTFREEDFSHFPSTVVILTLTLDSTVGSPAVARRAAEMFPDLLELPAMSRPPFAAHRFLSYLAETTNVSQIEGIGARLSQVGGVESVSSRLPGRERIYEGWIDNRIHEALNTDPKLGVRRNSKRAAPPRDGAHLIPKTRVTHRSEASGRKNPKA